MKKYILLLIVAFFLSPQIVAGREAAFYKLEKGSGRIYDEVYEELAQPPEPDEPYVEIE